MSYKRSRSFLAAAGVERKTAIAEKILELKEHFILLKPGQFKLKGNQKESSRIPEKIIKVDEGNQEFLMKWKGTDETTLIPIQQAKLMYPGIVLGFIIERLSVVNMKVNWRGNGNEATAFDRGFMPEKITGMDEGENGEVKYWIKWKNLGENEKEMVSASQANVICPRIVVDFLSEKFQDLWKIE